MINIELLKGKKNKNDIVKKAPLLKEWPNHVVTLEKNNFKTFIEKYPLSMVDFWAPWCKPCKIISPRVRRLSKIYKTKVAFGKLDVQKNQEISKQYKILGIPHLVFFSFGKKVSSLTGVNSIGEIKNLIDELLKKWGG